MSWNKQGVCASHRYLASQQRAVPAVRDLERVPSGSCPAVRDSAELRAGRPARRRITEESSGTVGWNLG